MTHTFGWTVAEDCNLQLQSNQTLFRQQISVLIFLH